MPWSIRSAGRSLSFRKKNGYYTINEPSPEYQVIYLGNVVTSIAKGEGCVDKPLALIWKTHQSRTRSDMSMELTICRSGLKAETEVQGITSYWTNRITHCVAPEAYESVFCWIYRHEGKKMKPELRCHAVLCKKPADPPELSSRLVASLQTTLREYKRAQIYKQNSRSNPFQFKHTSRRKQLNNEAINNFRPPISQSKTAPKLRMIEEGEEESEDEFDEGGYFGGSGPASSNVWRRMSPELNMEADQTVNYDPGIGVTGEEDTPSCQMCPQRSSPSSHLTPTSRNGTLADGILSAVNDTAYCSSVNNQVLKPKPKQKIDTPMLARPKPPPPIAPKPRHLTFSSPIVVTMKELHQKLSSVEQAKMEKASTEPISISCVQNSSNNHEMNSMISSPSDTTSLYAVPPELDSETDTSMTFEESALLSINANGPPKVNSKIESPNSTLSSCKLKEFEENDESKDRYPRDALFSIPEADETSENYRLSSVTEYPMPQQQQQPGRFDTFIIHRRSPSKAAPTAASTAAPDSDVNTNLTSDSLQKKPGPNDQLDTENLKKRDSGLPSFPTYLSIASTNFLKPQPPAPPPINRSSKRHRQQQQKDPSPSTLPPTSTTPPGNTPSSSSSQDSTPPSIHNNNNNINRSHDSSPNHYLFEDGVDDDNFDGDNSADDLDESLLLMNRNFKQEAERRLDDTISDESGYHEEKPSSSASPPLSFASAYNNNHSFEPQNHQQSSINKKALPMRSNSIPSSYSGRQKVITDETTNDQQRQPRPSKDDIKLDDNNNDTKVIIIAM